MFIHSKRRMLSIFILFQKCQFFYPNKVTSPPIRQFPMFGGIGDVGIDWYIVHLMSDPKGNSKFCFQESPDVSRDEVEGNIRTRGKTKLTVFPRDLALSDLLYF